MLVEVLHGVFFLQSSEVCDILMERNSHTGPLSRENN